METTMKALVLDSYGPPEGLAPRDIPAPAPGKGEILVRVRAAGISFGDLLCRDIPGEGRGRFNMPGPLFALTRLAFGWKRPRKGLILGSQFAGLVEALGEGAGGFAVGDAVVGYTGQVMGSCAELIAVPSTGPVARKPRNLGFEEASLLPYGALMARGILERAEIAPGARVLVVGASGGIGSIAVQLAALRGAKVTAVCGARNAGIVAALGAGEVLDYGKDDYLAAGRNYDLIVDILGRVPWKAAKGALAARGCLLMASFGGAGLAAALRGAFSRGKKAVIALAAEKREYLEEVCALVEAGKVRLPPVTAFPLARAGEAHRLAGSGRAVGLVAMTLD